MRMQATTIVISVLLIAIVVPVFFLANRDKQGDDAIISEAFVDAKDQGDRYYLEAQVLENRDNREQAVDFYTRALGFFEDANKHRPENGEIYNNMGAIHHKLGHLVAEPKYEEDITGYTVDDALYRLNDAFGDMPSGILVFEVNDPLVLDAVKSKAITQGCDVYLLNGDYSSDMYLIKGQTRDEFRRAEQLYKMAKTYKPRYGAAYQNLGTLYQETGRIDDAVIWWEAALEMEPHNRRLRAYLQQYR